MDHLKGPSGPNSAPAPATSTSHLKRLVEKRVETNAVLTGEDAERALIEHVVAEALRDGCEDIRLSPSGLQLDDAHFYESCGFREVDGFSQLSYAS